jgi:hypothetical protein
LLAVAKVGTFCLLFICSCGNFTGAELLALPAAADSRASEFLRDYDGSFIQMRMAYSAVAHFLVQWTDCKLAGALGLLKIMLYKVSSLTPISSRPCSIRSHRAS